MRPYLRVISQPHEIQSFSAEALKASTRRSTEKVTSVWSSRWWSGGFDKD
jgi:hypothetical protein